MKPRSFIRATVLFAVLTLFFSITTTVFAEDDLPGELQIPPKDGGGGGTIQGIGGSGTTNYIPKFTSSTNVGDSALYDLDGNIGIGTANPQTKLHLDAGNGAGNTELLRLSRGDQYGATSFYQHYGTADDAGLRILTGSGQAALTILNNSRNVGIGTTTPQAPLQVDAGNTAAALRVHAPFGDNNTSTPYLTLTGGYNTNNGVALRGIGDNLYGQKALALYAGWNTGAVGDNPTLSDLQERLRISSNGNVGIGTTSPAALLAVGSANQFTVSGNGDLTATGNAAIRAAQLSGVALHVGYDTAASLVVDGKIGIGTSQPEVPLEVVGDLQTRGGRLLLTQANPVNTLIIENATSGQAQISTNAPVPLTLGANVGGYTNQLFLDSSGRVGISTSGPQFPLDVAGQIRSSSGGFVFPDGSIQTMAAGASFWTGTGGDIYNINSGNVGIGTNAPQSKLEITTPSWVAIHSVTSSLTDGATPVSAEATATTGNIFGVRGQTYADGLSPTDPPGGSSGSTIGVYGVSKRTGSIGDVFGVLGEINGAGGLGGGPNFAAGVYGISYATSGKSAGTWGESNSSDASGAGIVGKNNATSGSTRGVWGEVNSASGVGIYGRNSTTGTNSTTGHFENGNADFANILEWRNGTLYAIRSNGAFASAIPTSDGDRSLFAPTSPEAWIEDFGEGKLTYGRASITLDPLFLEAATVDSAHPIKVFVQPNDATSGLYVRRGTRSFTVYEQEGGKGTATFTYRVLAKRKGMENARLDLIERKDWNK